MQNKQKGNQKEGHFGVFIVLTLKKLLLTLAMR